MQLEASWQALLKDEIAKPYFHKLQTFITKEYQSQQCFPPQDKIFSAFAKCPFDKLKVVILGQDPYHGEGQANGLAFSVQEGIKIPPSLNNIFKEISADLRQNPPKSGDLTRWATQGVLLLNATLTVRAHQAASHQNQGWEQFSDAVIAQIAAHKSQVAYLLWGSYAQKKADLINAQDNLILSSTHPSPLSAYRGFLGCRHFSKANEYLIQHKKTAISW